MWNGTKKKNEKQNFPCEVHPDGSPYSPGTESQSR